MNRQVIPLSDYAWQIPVRRRTLVFRVRGALPVPAFTGALWHAVLGPALRAEACQGPAGACDIECGRPGACAFGLVMQTRPRGASGTPLAGVARAPGPLVFDTAPWRARRLGPGDEFEITFTVVHPGAALAEMVARAMESAAGRGLGRTRVAAEYAGSSETAGMARLAPAVGEAAIRLRLLTPLRLKREGAFVGEFDLRALARDLSFRLAALGHYHGGQPWPAPWPEVMAEATRARVVRASTRWVDATRWSTRQGRRVVLGGLMGEVEVAEVGPALRTLLSAGAVLHAGKGASVGFGQLGIETLGGRGLRPREEDRHAAARR